MSFKPGDKVRFLHEKGEATVISVTSPHRIKVALSEGLEIDVSVSDIVPVKGMLIKDIEITPKEVTQKKAKRTTSKPHASHAMEVDLHIEELTDNYYNLSNAQKLNMQLNHFQNALEEAIKGHIKKIIFIHGVGNGILRQSIRDILKRYNGIEYSDGSYQKYGAGATEVRITSRTKAR